VTRNSSREVRRCRDGGGLSNGSKEERTRARSNGTYFDVRLLELEVEDVGVVYNAALLGRLGNDDEALYRHNDSSRSASLLLSFQAREKKTKSEGKKKAHPVQPVPNQYLRRRLPIFLREFNDDGVVEPLAADEGRPRFEDDTLRFAIVDEVDAGHEGVEVLWRGKVNTEGGGRKEA
jgi:hypothetical protein